MTDQPCEESTLELLMSLRPRDIPNIVWAAVVAAFRWCLGWRRCEACWCERRGVCEFCEQWGYSGHSE